MVKSEDQKIRLWTGMFIPAKSMEKWKLKPERSLNEKLSPLQLENH